MPQVPEFYSRRKRRDGQTASLPEQFNLDYNWGCGTGKMKPELLNSEDEETRLKKVKQLNQSHRATFAEIPKRLWIDYNGDRFIFTSERWMTQSMASACVFTPAVELKEKGKKGKAIHFAETDGPAADRLTDKKFASRDDKSPKALGKRGQQGNVTLHDAKFVALFLLQDTEMQRICSFTIFMRNKNLDNFLMALLYYLSHYLEKNSLEKQPKSYRVGLVEKKEMELVINKLEAAQKYLAQKYCILVLGLAMPDKHHMCCGKEKISDTQKDWKFFESFYTFCTYVAWIVFRRQHFTEIEEEIGRLFRTNLFNIPRRKREDEESGGEKKHMTLVQFRRMMAKRPAIKKAIHMRSPVMSTLLPSLREKAQDIFEKKNHQVGIKFPAQMQEHMESLDSVPMPTVGILGEPRCLFSPHTLLPLDLEENMKSDGRHSSLIEKNNMKIQDTLNLAMRTLSSQTTFPK